MSRQQMRGEQRTITLPLSVRDLAFYDEAQRQLVVESGEFEIRIGASSSDIRLRRSLHVV